MAGQLERDRMKSTRGSQSVLQIQDNKQGNKEGSMCLTGHSRKSRLFRAVCFVGVISALIMGPALWADQNPPTCNINQSNIGVSIFCNPNGTVSLLGQK